jgi:hypothetical protein
MKLWKASFKGVWLTGYGVVSASDYYAALEAMEQELLKGRYGLKVPFGIELEEIELEDGQAVVLWNGDY